MSKAAAVREVLRGVLAPVVEAQGYDLEDLEVTPAGKRRLVRVVLDRDGGVSLDDVADVSRAVSDALDTDPGADRALGGAPFVLEVTSPGVDRPLTEPRHWRRAVTRLVHVVLADGTVLDGRLVGASATTATVLGEDGEAREVAVDAVARAQVRVEFARREDDAVDAPEVDAHDAHDGDDGDHGDDGDETQGVPARPRPVAADERAAGTES